jgi:hypothetical protein
VNVLIGPYTENETPRQIEIRIDAFDTYSADHTLALIIAPLLKALKHDKHGAPLVDDEDVPEHLRSTAAPAPEFAWDIDDNHFKRWDWVLDEMIWAMEQIVIDDDSRFYDHSEVDDDADLNTQLKQMKVDSIALEQHHQRIVNGCVLFGKYFQSLWS